MRIGFCGTMSVGKTTLCHALKQDQYFSSYKFFTERSKYLRDLGIPLNTDSTYKGQIIFTAERASELLQGKNIITDRTVIDVMAFTINSQQMSIDEKKRILKICEPLVREYDILFYVSPEGVQMEDNGVRETDEKYRNDIDITIRELLLHNIPINLYTIKGSTEERIKIIKSSCNEVLFNENINHLIGHA